MFFFYKLKFVLTLLNILLNKTNQIFVLAKSLLVLQFLDWKQTSKFCKHFIKHYYLNKHVDSLKS